MDLVGARTGTLVTPRGGAGPSPRQQPARTTALTGLIGPTVPRRAFVDATGTPVPLPRAVRRVVATHHEVGVLLLDLGAPLVGCAGVLEGVEPVGEPGAPDPDAVAALRPDVIVCGTVDRAHDLRDAALLAALRRLASVVAVDLARPRAAAADLRALLGPATVERPAPAPLPDRPPGPPTTRPQLW